MVVLLWSLTHYSLLINYCDVISNNIWNYSCIVYLCNQILSIFLNNIELNSRTDYSI